MTSGFKCEGYDFSRLSYLKKEDRGVDSSLTLYRVCEGLPGVGPEERRGFAFFQHLTVPTLTGFFDNDLWTDLVLPMCHHEPAVSHAVVAVSVLHEEFEVRGVSLAREDLSLSRHRFALGQYGRALAILNQRRHSQDPKFLEVILTCCYLFVAFDVMRGQYDPALLHLKQGLAVLAESHRRQDLGMDSSKSTAITKSLHVALTRFRDQSYFFGLDPSCSIVSDGVTRSEYGFRTLYDARIALDDVISRFTVLMVVEKEHITEEFRFVADDIRAARLPALFKMKSGVKLEFEEWKERLIYSKSHTMPIKDRKDLRGLNILLLLHLTYYVVLDSVFLQDDRSFLIENVDYFRQIVAFCEQVSKSFQDESGFNSRPNLVLEMGVNASLFFVLWKCHDLSIRLQAIKLLEEWPHREGAWDSHQLVNFGKQMLQLEFDMRASTADPQAPMRLEIPSSKEKEDQKQSPIKYQVRGQSQEVLEQRQVLLFDEETSGDSMLKFCLRTQRYIHSN